jgi:preprotein translocase subunit SecG
MLVRFLLGFAVVFSSLFLIALVLIQRGRGGGLAGALGGMGGQSAFGTKAGDVFTRITVVAASCWILLCILALNVLGPRDDGLLDAKKLGGANAVTPVEPQIQPADKAADAEGEAAKPDAAATPSAEAAPAAGTESTPSAEAKPADGAAAPAADAAPAAEAPAAPAN